MIEVKRGYAASTIGTSTSESQGERTRLEERRGVKRDKSRDTVVVKS
jgi:hypothetical protein